MPEMVIGTGLSHDGASCLLVDGRVEAGIEKERLTRIKHDGFNDDLTIAYCLEALGLRWQDITVLVENLTHNAFEAEDDIRRGNRAIPSSVPRVAISHHLAHAYSALGPAPFPEMAVIVVDGRGSSLDNCTDAPASALSSAAASLPSAERHGWFEMTSVYAYSGSRLSPVLRDFSPLTHDDLHSLGSNCRMIHSIGEFYGRIAQWVFGHDFSEGKLMGLAPYGRPGVFSGEAVSIVDGYSSVDLARLDQFDAKLSGTFRQNPDAFQLFADVAYWAQRELERALLELFRWARRHTGLRRAAYAGGVALNAVANRRLILESGFEEIYVQPAAGDNGIALGCCQYGWLEVLGRERRPDPRRTSFGRRYNSKDNFSLLDGVDDGSFAIERPKDLFDVVAERLAAGEVIGWFRGPSEYGPRALGHRSILADPRGKMTRDFINREVKKREDFRPFAPVVIENAAHRYFDGAYLSPHMTFVMKTRPEWEAAIPAVVHCDGTARVQTVSQSDNLDLYELLGAFERRTGLPILLNTSFNGRDMPIVETPAEAMAFFRNSALHALVLEDVLMTKRDAPDLPSHVGARAFAKLGHES